MITFPKLLGPDGRPLVRQVLKHPAVYLDTWAIRLFAEDRPALGERFRDALKRAQGTLMLSHLSIAEFTFADPRHTRAAGRFIDTLLPMVFFSMFDPFKVMNAEIPVMVRQTSESPAGDPAMLSIYANAAEQRGSESVIEWFEQMYVERAKIAALRESMAQAFLDGIRLLRDRFDTGEGFAKSALRDIEMSTRPRSTQALLRAILYLLHRDSRRQLTINDALDLCHCIVPAAYSDLVVLDRAWAAQVKAASTFLRRCKIESRVALQFNRREIEGFLSSLESWPLKRNAA